MPDDWNVEEWLTTRGGVETVWYSPGCKNPEYTNAWENKGVVDNVFEEMYAEPPLNPLEGLLSILRGDDEDVD